MSQEFALATGSLGGPIAAHFTINYVNLRYIVGSSGRMRENLRRRVAAA